MKKKLLVLFIISIMMVTFAACGSKGGSSKTPPIGSFTVTGIIEDGIETSEEEITTLKDMGLAMTVELKSDNTGVITLFGESVDVTWDEENITMEGDAIPYTFDGTTLTLNQDTTSYIFTKDE